MYTIVWIWKCDPQRWEYVIILPHKSVGTKKIDEKTEESSHGYDLRENYSISKFEGHPMSVTSDNVAPVYGIAPALRNKLFLPSFVPSVHLQSLL